MSQTNTPPKAPQMKPGMGRGPGHGPGGMMTGPVQKAKDFKGSFKKLLQYLKPAKFRLIIVFFMAIGATVFSIWSPKVMGKAITSLFNGLMMKMKGIEGAGIDFKYISHILLILGFLYLSSAIFNFLMQYIMASVAQKAIYTMRNDVKEKLTRLPLKFYDSHSHGDVLSRVLNDIDLVSTTLQQSLTQVITAVVSIIGITIMMLTISPLLTLVTILTLPLSFFGIRSIAKHSQKYFAKQQKELGDLNGHIEEMFTGHKEIKLFNREQESINAFEEKNESLYQVGWKAQFISGVIMPIMNSINSLGYVLISVVGGIFVTKRMIEIGDIQAFIQYSRQFSQPITQTANIANMIQSTIAAAERVFEILDEEEEIQDSKNPMQLKDPQGFVSLEHVYFSYLPETPLIQDFNLSINKGESVAIVGPTGAGKTTLVNLLMRFYEIQSGKIKIDGIDIRDLKRYDLRKVFGMVLQDTWLFKGSIRENIAYGKENASEDEIIEVAKAAHADHFIRTLPDGYDTILNEDASNISQGQRQLLTIARAFLADPAILILDEATSSVDTRTELIIQKAMAALMKNRTSFVIAHRLSTIKEAHTILVMNQGSIIEQGNHRDLIAANGFYADLYNSQFQENE